MLNLALVGLLAGSLASGTPDGDKDKDKKTAPEKPATEAAAGAAVPLLLAAPAAETTDPQDDPRSIIQDTYAFGMASDLAPIKLWVHYAYGEAERLYGYDGQTRSEISIAGTNYDLVSQRIGVGAQINLLNFPSFKFGVGGQLNVAQNEYQVGSDGDPLGVGELDSGFGLQGVKVYGLLKGRVVGVHGGYIFDLGNEQEFGPARPELGGASLPTDLPNSDGRDAGFFGADFDYPSERFRLFAGADLYLLEGAEPFSAENPTGFEFSDESNDGDNIIFWTAGAGVRLSVFEIGAALHIRTQLKQGGPGRLGETNPATGVLTDYGSHLGSIAPYLRISPPNLPASLFVKGSVLEEYTDYGYSMGGANDFVTRLGFTAGLTVGFE